MKEYILERVKSKPGSVVQRFGHWQKGEPTVLVDNQKWLDLGKPDELTVTFEGKIQAKVNIGELTGKEKQFYGKKLSSCQ